MPTITVLRLIVAGCCLAAPLNAVEAPSGAAVVLELFTSEGCSSCPAAEAALATLRREAETGHRQLYALLFPVDYWDRLGWQDPYAQHAFTERQEAYAQRLGLAQLFTPQVIVNGAVSLVGSDLGGLHRAIAVASARPSRVTVTQTAQWRGDGVHVAIHLEGAPPTARVLVALSESGLRSAIQVGENAGRTEVHADVVRDWTTVQAADAGLAEVRLVPPAGAVRRNLALTVVAQDEATWAVLGAARGRIAE